MAKGRELVFRVDALNEREVLAAEILSPEFGKDMARHEPDVYLVPEHQGIHRAVRETVRMGVQPTPATLVRLSNEAVDVRYVEELIASHPDLPATANLDLARTNLLQDKQKHTLITGPIDAILAAVQANEPFDRLRGLAKSAGQCLEGWGDREHMIEPRRLVDDQMADVRRRMAGHAVYPYGLPGLDFDLDTQQRRMVPGSACGQITVVTGVPGSGKSTTCARLVLGLVRQRRKVLYGAWEMKGGTTLELIACQSLAERNEPPGDWSRTKLSTPDTDHPGWWTPDREKVLRDRMTALSEYVRFMGNPFRRGTRGGSGKPSNRRNLDLVAGYVADSGCEVFVADLWKRCLAETKPEEEEEALIDQQAIVEELGVHAILVQQQRLKDVEMRADKRPTREGIKGSGAWVEVADTMIGVHCPARWKPIPDNVLELDILKQRYGKWPQAVEFAWDPDRGMITKGTTVAYDVSAARFDSNPIDAMVGPPQKGNRQRR